MNHNPDHLHVLDQALRTANGKLQSIPQHAVAMIFTSLGAALLQLALAAPAIAQSDDADLLQRLHDGHHVLMLRHASAPGTGDPEQFQIGDCSTQRNLDDSGREQARAIGRWLKNKGIASARVYSSQWCRCLETASLMGIGAVLELPALNSFYEMPQNRGPNLRALREFLATLPAAQSPIVLVTHQVTISAITGDAVASGQGVLVEVADDERYTIRARLRFEP